MGNGKDGAVRADSGLTSSRLIPHLNDQATTRKRPFPPHRLLLSPLSAPPPLLQPANLRSAPSTRCLNPEHLGNAPASSRISTKMHNRVPNPSRARYILPPRLPAIYHANKPCQLNLAWTSTTPSRPSTMSRRGSTNCPHHRDRKRHGAMYLLLGLCCHLPPLLHQYTLEQSRPASSRKRRCRRLNHLKPPSPRR